VIHILKGFLKVKLDEDTICTFTESDNIRIHDGYIEFFNVRFIEGLCNKRHLKLHESKQYAFSLDNVVEYSIMQDDKYAIDTVM
jgi:hypothetical protein